LATLFLKKEAGPGRSLVLLQDSASRFPYGTPEHQSFDACKVSIIFANTLFLQKYSLSCKLQSTKLKSCIEFTIYGFSTLLSPPKFNLSLTHKNTATENLILKCSVSLRL
jgi:hypothetical protein